MANATDAFDRFVESAVASHIFDLNGLESPSAIMCIAEVLKPLDFVQRTYCAAHSVTIPQELIRDMAGEICGCAGK